MLAYLQSSQLQPLVHPFETIQYLVNPVIYAVQGNTQVHHARHALHSCLGTEQNAACVVGYEPCKLDVQMQLYCPMVLCSARRSR